ncbi:RNA pol II transcription cofactor [Basidiobolus ranarum]|uniref:RNA pol II transcription cofactor n=1 Tax=Basidiobolus ranarum TaxID=34480 RepID=A0ABR2VMA7_9FUNG
MGQRKVIKVVEALPHVEGFGASVRRSVGSEEVETLDPFILLDEFLVAPPSGFPDHPHRGFETVTYVLQGTSEHEDFAGHRGEINSGDLQWMSAGRGIVHAEMPKTECHGLQLWVNLRSSQKMDEPNYQEIRDKDIPRATLENGTTVKIISGEAFGVKSDVFTKTPTLYLDIHQNKNERICLDIPDNYNGFVYVIKGCSKFGETQALGSAHMALILDRPGCTLDVVAVEETHYVLIAGEPLNEPIVQMGPFVMNTDQEIQSAVFEHREGFNGFENADTWKSTIGQ